MAQIHRGLFRSTKVGFTTTNYAGPAKNSFAEGSPSYGLELSIDGGNSYTRYFYRARVNESIGGQNFIKNGTTYFSNYEFYSVEPEIGGALYPVQRQEHGLNIYLWVVGNLSYNFLNLKSVPSTVNVDPKSQALGYGAGGGIGFELIFASTKGGNKLMVYSEVGFRDGTAGLAGQNSFEVSGLTASVGFGF